MTKTGKGMAEQAKRSASFAAASPDVIEAFNLMRSRCCNDEGVLSFKTKELIAVAVAAARKCEPCLRSHIKVAIEVGATRQELVEALNIAVLLCGGPGWAYSSIALDAYDDMLRDQEEAQEEK